MFLVFDVDLIDCVGELLVECVCYLSRCVGCVVVECYGFVFV